MTDGTVSEGHNRFEDGLERNAANFVALSPISFMARSAHVFADQDAWRHFGRCMTWAECFVRCRRLGAWLEKDGVERGDVVATLLPNVPAMFELHFGVPATGAVLNTLNIRLDASALAFMLAHGGAKILFADAELLHLAEEAVALVAEDPPRIIEVADEGHPPSGRYSEYEQILKEGDPAWLWRGPDDEWDAIGLNYTSGTTGNPKGVVVHHRGAYLNAVSNAVGCELRHREVYLWTLPMFHCNGWCFPWTMALLGGTSICLRRVDAEIIFDLIHSHSVTSMCGAPIVYSTLLASDARSFGQETRNVKAMIAGAAPPASVIKACSDLGIHIVHVYGLTEVYGPAAICMVKPAWKDESVEQQARLTARQGVVDSLQEAMEVADPKTGVAVPWDGEAVGEIRFRGNIVMKGYLDNPAATQAAFHGGAFNTGDLAVVEPDGYVRILDRSKDIVISGGENISSIEVEDALYGHPHVLHAAVVAKPDDKWGEVPCAIVELKTIGSVTEDELIAYCRTRLAQFKVPKQVIFAELPKTSTGKVQKFLLRDQLT